VPSLHPHARTWRWRYGGKDGPGGSGGSGGSGGNAQAKRKRLLESPEEKEARRKVLRDKARDKVKCKSEIQEEKEARLKVDSDKDRERYAALRQEDRAARNKTRRDKHNWALTVQAVTHLLLALLFPRCEELLVQQKLEIDKFLDAVHAASPSPQAPSLLIKARSWRFRFSLPSLAAQPSN